MAGVGNNNNNNWIEQVLKQTENKDTKSLNLYSLASIASIGSNISNNKPEFKKSKEENLERLVLSTLNTKFDSVTKWTDKIRDACQSMGHEVLDITAKTLSRTTPGISSTFGMPLFEGIGLSFHPILNLPYISGSTIKGATRSAFQKLECKDGDRYFGNENEGGEIFFADAYPLASEKPLLLWPDITNPQYFNKGETILREDKVISVPLVHLTISIGSTFRFLIACKPNTNYEDILSAFTLACKMGLGARKNIGYGCFEILEVK